MKKYRVIKITSKGRDVQREIVRTGLSIEDAIFEKSHLNRCRAIVEFRSIYYKYEEEK